MIDSYNGTTQNFTISLTNSPPQAIPKNLYSAEHSIILSHQSLLLTRMEINYILTMALKL